MKIERLIDGCKIEIELTSEELNKAYAEEKRKLDIQEVRNVLTELNPGDTLKMCSFPYPSHRYLRDDKIEEAEQNIMDNEELMLQISDQFQEIQVMCNSSYNKSMEAACKGYETIEVIAYQRYQQDWIRNRHYSEAFLQRIHKEHEEYFQVNRCISFAEYIDEFGFEGECYACIDEFLESEYLDETYMKSLLDEKEYLEYLIDQYQNLIYSICLKSVGNPFDAEDLTQEVFLSAYKSLAHFDGLYEKAWLSKIAVRNSNGRYLFLTAS